MWLGPVGEVEPWCFPPRADGNLNQGNLKALKCIKTQGIRPGCTRFMGEFDREPHGLILGQ